MINDRTSTDLFLPTQLGAIEMANRIAMAPSAIKAEGNTYTVNGFVPVPMPRALETDEIPAISAQYGHAAENA